MAAANPAQNLREEASCSICLQYFTDPVSIDCGHNFCRSCITQCWERLVTNFPCPQCREISPQRILRPNRQLANVAEITKQLLLMTAREAAEGFCEKHKEPLKLFCEDDQIPICMVCGLSRDHKAHTMFPIEEAAEEYKLKLQQWLEWLREKLGDVQTWQSNEKQKTGELKKQVAIQRQRIICEFEKLQQLLNEERQVFLCRLEKEEGEILQTLEANISQLTEQSSFLEKRIAEIEKKQQQPVTEFLKEVKNLLPRKEFMNFPQPTPDDVQLRKNSTGFPYQDFALIKILKKLKVSAASVTLDPETASHQLILSADRKHARQASAQQGLSLLANLRFSASPCVLGCEGFTSGRHYWEVQMRTWQGCSVGAARESVNRNGGIYHFASAFSQIQSGFNFGNQTIGLKIAGLIESPENGIWAVDQWEDGYRALTSPVTPLSPSQSPRKLGVYLDYDGGRLSFYNAESLEHIYTFTASFTERIFPFFRVWEKGEITL